MIYSNRERLLYALAFIPGLLIVGIVYGWFLELWSQ